MNKFEYDIKIQSTFTPEDWTVIFERLKDHYEMALGGRLYGIKNRISFAIEAGGDDAVNVFSDIYLNFRTIDYVIGKAFEHGTIPHHHHIFIKCVKMLQEINEETTRLYQPISD